MKTLMILFLCTLTARATLVPVDLGSSRTVDREIFLSTNALTGTGLNGQTISLDYQFSSLIRLFRSTGSSFYIAIRAETNVVPDPFGLYPSVSQSDAYVRGLNGFQGPTLAAGPNHLLFGPNVTEILFGLVYSMNPAPALHDPVYLTGMHFDLTLPDIPGVEITGLRLHLDANTNNPYHSQWSITDTVPDAGTSISLLALGLMGIAGFRYR